MLLALLSDEKLLVLTDEVLLTVLLLLSSEECELREVSESDVELVLESEVLECELVEDTDDEGADDVLEVLEALLSDEKLLGDELEEADVLDVLVDDSEELDTLDSLVDE